MEQFCVGYACEVIGGPSWQSIEERLRDECSRRFPDAIWGGMFIDDYKWRRFPLWSRPEGLALNAHVIFRRVDIVLFANAYDAFRRLSDLTMKLRAWDDRVTMVALDVDLSEPAAIEQWGRRLHKLRADEAIAVARATDQPLGKPPLGWRSTGPRGGRRLRRNPIELAMMREAFELRGRGLSRTEVARTLMLAGKRSPRTKHEWSAMTCVRAAEAYASLIGRGLVPPLPAA